MRPYRTLPFHRSAHERASAQSKSPRQMRGTLMPIRLSATTSKVACASRDEAMARIDAEIHLMMPIGDIESLRQFSRPGTKLAKILHAAPFLHQLHRPAAVQSRGIKTKPFASPFTSTFNIQCTP